MTNSHEEFAEMMRSILRNEEEKKRESNRRKGRKSTDEDSRSLHEMLEANFDVLFGMLEDED